MNYEINAAVLDYSTFQFATIYDRLPYKRNVALCSADCIQQFSGNVIKYFSCCDVEPRQIPNQDGLWND